MTQRYWRALIEENAHEAAGSGHLNRQGGLGEFEDRQSLLAGHAGKPFEELVHRRAAFQILEERLHRYACPREHPGPAYLAGNALHCRTLCPIQHASQTTLSPGHGQAGSSLQTARNLGAEKTKLLDRIDEDLESLKDHLADLAIARERLVHNESQCTRQN